MCFIYIIVGEGSFGYRWEREYWIKMVRGVGEKIDEDLRVVR